MLQDDVLEHGFVVDEIAGPQDGGAKAHGREHAFGAELHREVRHVDRAVGAEDREIDDPLDAALPGDVEGDECLGEFVAGHGVEQEEGGNAAEGAAQGGEIEQVALHDLDGGRKIGSGRVAGQHPDLGIALHELLDEVAAYAAGGASDEDGHVGNSRWVRGGATLSCLTLSQ